MTTRKLSSEDLQLWHNVLEKAKRIKEDAEREIAQYVEEVQRRAQREIELVSTVILAYLREKYQLKEGERIADSGEIVSQ